jgi:hypothetical protein
MIPNRPLRQLIAENQVLTPENAMFLAHLDAFHRIVRKSRSGQEERKVVAETPRATRINGVLSDKQMSRFFSFLYLETSSNGKPFITKEVFDIVFRNGLVIPDVPLKEKYSINCSLSSPRNQIDYAIHLLMRIHKGGKKAPYLKFFGSYFEQYRDALVSPRKLEMLASNITGIKSTRCKIEFEKYFPVIFKNNSCYFIK